MAAVSKCCPTFVIAKKNLDASGPPTIFRTYGTEGIRPNKCPLWQAARATTAAPSFFKPTYIAIPPPGIHYVDGGLGYNNPAQIALVEAHRIWPDSEHFCLVSIGTGHQKALTFSIQEAETDADTQRSVLENIKSYLPSADFVPGWRTAKNFEPGLVALIKMATGLAQIATNAEDTHRYLQREAKANKNIKYYRFNVERDVGDIGLQDWKRQEDIHAHTAAYLEEEEVEEKKAACVKDLLDSPPRLTSKQLVSV